MNGKNNPEQFSHAEFTAAVAADTGVPAAELTGRADATPDVSDPLLETARHNNEQRPDVGHIPETLRPIADQYTDQLEMLKEYGVLGEGNLEGIVAITGDRWVPPTAEELERLLAERADVLEQKIEQGFTKLIVVPFAGSLDRLAEKYGEALKEAHSKGTLLDSSGQPLELDTNEPVWIWDPLKNADAKGELVYRPEEFGDNHNGMTKEEIIGVDGTPGWRLLLVEEGMSDIPKAGQGKTIGGRPQLECGKNSTEYLRILRDDPAYENEVGLTPEAYLALAMTELKENHRVLDDETYTALVDSYLPGQREVPYADWDRGIRRAYLNAVGPDLASDDWGPRSAVRVT